MVTASQLVEFERRVAEEFERGNIRGPVHLSGGNEHELIEIFQSIKDNDLVFSTWRNHYHALLHGVPEQRVWNEIINGRSMNLSFWEHSFYSSAIVGGILPIAVGAAYAIKSKRSRRKVWCFIGDMAATTGAFHEANKYAMGHELPIRFFVEDNGVSTNTPTEECWGFGYHTKVQRYAYNRTYPHVGIGKWVSF